MSKEMNVFKFSESQIQVLKNFASIFPSLAIYPDKTEVINGVGTVIGTYKFDQPLPIKNPFGILDLNRFLSVLAFYKTPSIRIEEKWVTVSDEASSVKYYTTPLYLIPKVVVQQVYTPLDIINKLNDIGSELEFVFTAEKLTTLLKIASIMKPKFLYIETYENAIKITIGDSIDSSDNTWNTLITDGIKRNELKNPMKFELSELKVMVLDYDVRISSKNMSQWSNSFGVNYFIGCYADSKE